jgi:hypothetical protein
MLHLQKCWDIIHSTRISLELIFNEPNVLSKSTSVVIKWSVDIRVDAIKIKITRQPRIERGPSAYHIDTFLQIESNHHVAILGNTVSPTFMDKTLRAPPG